MTVYVLTFAIIHDPENIDAGHVAEDLLTVPSLSTNPSELVRIAQDIHEGEWGKVDGDDFRPLEFFIDDQDYGVLQAIDHHSVGEYRITETEVM